LDAHNPETFYNGGTVQLWRCGGASNQKWLVQRQRSSMETVQQTVQLCGHLDCWVGGNNYFATVGDWDRMPHQIGDNELTRVHIPQGYAFQYFEDPYFGGWNRIHGSHDKRLQIYMVESNDAVSSFRIRKLPDGKVKLCRHPDCTGGVYYASVGQFPSMPIEIGDNQLSFVLIPPGYTFEYFEHGRWGGWSGKFGSCSNTFLELSNLSMVGISSFKIGLAC
jgi:hypothetical protein